MEELTIIEKLSQLRITASSQIPPHEFLYTWNGTPCFAKGELVAVTGKAKSGKTYLNSLLMAAASGQTFIGLKSLSDKPLRVLWIDTEQSPDSACEIPQTATSSSAPAFRQDKTSFNPEYLTPDGKIDKAHLFGSVLKDNSLTWNDLRSQIMNAANIRSVHFAEKLIAEARDSGLLQTILNSGSRLYAIQRQQQLFDEDT